MDDVGQITLRLPPEGLRALDERIEQLRAQNPGLNITRGVAARMLLMRDVLGDVKAR